MLFATATFQWLYFVLLCILSVVRLSVPTQVIDWKDWSPKWHITGWRGR